MSTVTHQNKYSETPNVRTLLACLKGKSVYQKTPKQLQWDSYCGDIYLPTWKGRMSTVTHQNKYSETPNVRTLLACLKGKSVYQKTPNNYSEIPNVRTPDPKRWTKNRDQFKGNLIQCDSSLADTGIAKLKCLYPMSAHWKSDCIE